MKTKVLSCILNSLLVVRIPTSLFFLPDSPSFLDCPRKEKSLESMAAGLTRMGLISWQVGSWMPWSASSLWTFTSSASTTTCTITSGFLMAEILLLRGSSSLVVMCSSSNSLEMTWRDWAHMKGQRPPGTLSVVPGMRLSSLILSSATR